MNMVIETGEFTFAESKDEAYWIDRKKQSELAIKMLKADLEAIPRHIAFHEAVIKMCEGKIKKDENRNMAKK